jgi:hypothetical protein
LNFSYRIGKMSVDGPPRRRRSINNDDLKDGGGDGGMGGGMGDGQPQQRGQGQQNGAAGGQRSQNAPAQRSQATPAQSTPAVADSVIFQPEGTWNFTIDSPQGGSGTIILKNENGVYSGTIKTNRMAQETSLNNITVKGNDVSFSYPVSFGGNTNTVEVMYKVSNNDIHGTLTMAQFGTFNLVGNRTN